MLDNLRALREATATTIAFETQGQARPRRPERARQEPRAAGRGGAEAGNEKLARRALQLQVEAQGAPRERAEADLQGGQGCAPTTRAAKLKVEEERVQGKIRQLGELKAIHAMNDAQKRMQAITDEYNIDGAVTVFDKTAGSIQEQADKLSAMDTIAVSEGEDLDRQLAAISQKTEVDAALDALKARLGEAGTAPPPLRPRRRRRSPRPSTRSRRHPALGTGW